jgi:hypothetical protein
VDQVGLSVEDAQAGRARNHVGLAFVLRRMNQKRPARANLLSLGMEQMPDSESLSGCFAAGIHRSHTVGASAPVRRPFSEPTPGSFDDQRGPPGSVSSRRAWVRSALGGMTRSATARELEQDIRAVDAELARVGG